MLWQLLLVAVTLWAVYFRWQGRRLRKICNEISSGEMRGLPIIGHLHLLGGSHEDIMNFIKRNATESNKQDGSSSFWFLNRLYINVTEPVVTDVIAKSCLDKDFYFNQYARTITGNGSIFAPVKIWRPRRKIIAPMFSIKNLNYFEDTFAEQSAIMVEQLSQVAGKGDFSIWKYFNTYTFDSICENSMGIQMKTQLNPDNPFLIAMDKVFKLAAQRLGTPWLHPDVIYNFLPMSKEFKKYKHEISSFVDQHGGDDISWEEDIKMASSQIWKKVAQADIKHPVEILGGGLYAKAYTEIGDIDSIYYCTIMVIKTKRDALAQNNKELFDTHGRYTFLDMLISLSGGEKGFTDVELREETMVMLGAGTDTSAVGASYATVLLSRYPDIQAKVYTELQEVLGDLDRPLNMKDLHNLKYLDAVMKETLRLYPPVPVVSRQIDQDVTLPSGTVLVEDVGIFLNIWGTHRNPKYWGEDAEQFRPERFLDHPLQHPGQFIPFSYSLRNCVGNTYAMLSMKTAIATLLRSYQILPPKDLDPSQWKEPMRVKFDIMMKPVEGYIVRLELRKK